MTAFGSINIYPSGKVIALDFSKALPKAVAYYTPREIDMLCEELQKAKRGMTDETILPAAEKPKVNKRASKKDS